MSNPWSRPPPLPTVGDLDPDDTYAGVGRVMSAWETIEFELCMILSVYSEDPGGEAMRLYGSRNFPSRLGNLGNASEKYRIRNPNQHNEGDFDCLLEQVQMYYQRRNEVAHGVVLRLSQFQHYRDHLTNKDPEPPQYGVIPPYHMVRAHGADGLPLYAYTSASMDALLEQLMALWDKLKDYRRRL